MQFSSLRNNLQDWKVKPGVTFGEVGSKSDFIFFQLLPLVLLFVGNLELVPFWEIFIGVIEQVKLYSQVYSPSKKIWLVKF